MKICAFLLALIGALAARTQSSISTPTFVVASIRELQPSQSQSIKEADIQYKGGNLYMRGTTLSYALEWAYDIRRFQIDGPQWIFWRSANDQPRFDIIAKADPATTKQQARLMLQALLTERFDLKMRYEDRGTNGFELHDDSHGLKVERIEPNEEPSVVSFDRQIGEGGKGKYKNMSVEEFIEDLSLTLHSPVIDKTSLGKQLFNGSFAFEYQRGIDNPVDAYIAALDKDMGLSLSKAKVTIHVLVLDHVLRNPINN